MVRLPVNKSGMPFIGNIVPHILAEIFFKYYVTVQSQPPKCFAFRRCGVSAKWIYVQKCSFMQACFTLLHINPLGSEQLQKRMITFAYTGTRLSVTKKIPYNALSHCKGRMYSRFHPACHSIRICKPGHLFDGNGITGPD